MNLKQPLCKFAHACSYQFIVSIYFHDKAEKADFERQVKSLRDENTRLNQQLTRVKGEHDTIKKDFTELQTEKIKVETELKNVEYKMEQQLDQMMESNVKEIKGLRDENEKLLKDDTEVRVKLVVIILLSHRGLTRISFITALH